MGQVVAGMWAVWFRDHVHTNIHGQFAIFATRKAARLWMRQHGIPGCRVARLAVTT